MSEYLTTFYFILTALILFVILVFLYKVMMAMGRLDRRLEQLTRHLRDLNLYDFHPVEEAVLGEATELENDANSTDSTDSSITPSRYREGSAGAGGESPPSGTDTTPLRFRPADSETG